MSLTAVNLSDSLPQKSLKITFIFANSAQTPIEIEGLRTEVSIEQTGQESGASAKIKLHAPDFEAMLQILQGNRFPLQKTPLMQSLSEAEVKVEAGERKSSHALIFHGKVTCCHAGFAPPNRCLTLTANAALFYNTQTLRTLSYDKPVWASEILKDLCDAQKTALKNNGFDYLLRPPFSLNGTFLSQVKRIVKAQNGFFHFDALENSLFVAKDNFSNGDGGFVLEESDLIGFPSYSEQLLTLRCLFRPAAKLGGKFFLRIPEIKIENIHLHQKNSVSPPWNGEWIIHSFCHLLSSEQNAIKWETHLSAFRLS